MRKYLHAALIAPPIFAGWLVGTAVKVWILTRAAFIEGYEAGRKLS
jgi:hypothetical protein